MFKKGQKVIIQFSIIEERSRILYPPFRYEDVIGQVVKFLNYEKPHFVNNKRIELCRVSGIKVREIRNKNPIKIEQFLIPVISLKKYTTKNHTTHANH